MFSFYLCKETNKIYEKEEDPSIKKENLEEKEVKINSKKDVLYEAKKKTVEEKKI